MSLKYGSEELLELPFIRNNDSFALVITQLCSYLQEAVQTPATFEDLRTPLRSRTLNMLSAHLTDSVRHKQIVPALLALRSYFAGQTDDEPGINLARAYACEYVAWRFVLQLSEWELIDCLLEDLDLSMPASNGNQTPNNTEHSLLLSPARQPGQLEAHLRQRTREQQVEWRKQRSLSLRISSVADVLQGTLTEDDIVNPAKHEAFAMYFTGLNALEVAAVADAKKFLSQRVVQRLIERIWKGDIVFWETMDVDSIKEAKVYNKRKADPFCRLRVPRYLKFFEAMFFLSFLALYYAVLIPIQRNGRHPTSPSHGDVPRTQISLRPTDASTSFHSITGVEILLYVWIVGFAYDEFGEFLDAGKAFYSTDFWSLWDLGIVAIGLAFFICRVIGLVKRSDEIIGIAFDILSLEALFLVPRICSVLSLNSYFGTLIPCLREMTKDFIKFLSLVVILYVGFLTTFTLLARDNFTAREMTVILVKVFFGSSYLGFEVASDISPALGWPLMLIFVVLTNILLITSLISLLSNSLAKVLEHAREEYLFIYSVYVLEASTSNRLTYYLPPLNLLALLLRPLKLVMSPARLRRARIILLKITHAPYVLCIWAFENVQDYFTNAKDGSRMISSTTLKGPSTAALGKRNKQLPLESSFLTATQTDNGVAREAANDTPSTEDVGGSAVVGEHEDLKVLVMKLMAKVEQLSDQLAAQK